LLQPDTQKLTNIISNYSKSTYLLIQRYSLSNDTYPSRETLRIGL